MTIAYVQKSAGGSVCKLWHHWTQCVQSHKPQSVWLFSQSVWLF